MSIRVRVTITDMRNNVQLAERVADADGTNCMVEEAAIRAAERATKDATDWAKLLFQEPRRLANYFETDIEKL